MPLSTGGKLGHYEVLSLLGQGGMGEVYKARDTTLKRDVALKVLPASFLRDTERMARFQREAEVLASLDHPNVGTIYGIIDSEDSRGLVLALIEGPTLADQIALGPVPLDDALSIAKQIAEALEYAHDRGVVHRDLKPANIKITPEGVVKVLDFGLAKVLEDEPPKSALANSPTMTLGHTRAGVILGTAAYMSPEQAIGRPVDRRSDIFSFGAVLYELLTGKRAFAGATTPDVLEAVVKSDPDWSALPAGTPVYLRRLLERMLAKDRKLRLQAIGEARIALAQPQADESAPPKMVSVPSSSRFGLFALTAAVVFFLAAAALGFVLLREKSAVAELVQFSVSAPAKTILNNWFALSPNGRNLAFMAGGNEGEATLWIRSFDSLELKRLAEVRPFTMFFWSPDSRYVAFQSAGKLKKIDIAGGPPETLCDVSAQFGGGAWSPDGTILFGDAKGLMRVPAAGGTPVAVTARAASRQETAHSMPSLLPDGRHFVYLRISQSPDNSGVYAGSLDTAPEKQSAKRLLATDYAALFAASADGSAGRLFFMRENALMAQSFDSGKLELIGEATRVIQPVGRNTVMRIGSFSVSPNNVLAYRAGQAAPQQLTWFDRDGKVLSTVGAPGQLGAIALSPDGTRAALTRPNAENNSDIWLLDLARDVATQFTFGPKSNRDPVWSPDGKRIAYASLRDGVENLYSKASDGAGDEEVLLRSRQPAIPESWSPDGRNLIYATRTDPKTQDDLFVLPLNGDRKPAPFLQTEALEGQGQFSPDGKWVAYVSAGAAVSDTGLFVRSFPDGASKFLISSEGPEPRWRGDGKELYYRNGRKIMAVEISTSPVFRAGAPKTLFEAPISGAGYFTNGPRWMPTADGKRFLAVTNAADVPTPITVVLNWRAEKKN